MVGLWCGFLHVVYNMIMWARQCNCKSPSRNIGQFRIHGEAYHVISLHYTEHIQRCRVLLLPYRFEWALFFSGLYSYPDYYDVHIRMNNIYVALLLISFGTCRLCWICCKRSISIFSVASPLWLRGKDIATLRVYVRYKEYSHIDTEDQNIYIHIITFFRSNWTLVITMSTFSFSAIQHYQLEFGACIVM